MARPVVITSVPEAPDVERHRRVVTYVVMMSIRTACFVAMIFVQDWWRFVLLIAAVVLPYLSVVRANVHFAPRTTAPRAPASELPRGSGDAHDAGPDAGTRA